MKMKWIALLPLSVVFVGLLFPDASLSCSCEFPGTPLEELASHDAVFIGRVVEIVEPSEDRDYEWILFKRSAVWKGPLGEGIAIRTRRTDEPMCGFSFEVGGEYLVYALLEDGALETSICSRTSSLAVATEDVALLGEPLFRYVTTSVDPMSWGGVKLGHLLASGSGLF